MRCAGTAARAVARDVVQTSFLIPPLALQYMQSGRMRGLAVTTTGRSPALPALPTLREAGIADYEVTQWHGFFAPAKTPAAIVNRLHAELVRTLAAADIKQRLVAEGAEVAGTSPAELGAFLAAEIKMWTELAQRIGLALE